MRNVRLCSLVLFALGTISSHAHAQANIDESQETAYLYVDVVHGNDNNPGTQQKPFKTIGKSVAVAEENNRNSIGTRVTINQGLYRENIVLEGFKTDTDLPETFEAATPGSVFITGADQFTNWTPYSGNSSIYTTSWSHWFGECTTLKGKAPYQQEIVLRQEMAFINGVPLTQVMSLNQMLEGTFYVDEQGKAFYIWPPPGVNLDTADVELSDRPLLWQITDKNSVVLRGLTFEYSPDCIGDGAVDVINGGAQNVEFDTDTFVWNNAVGLKLFNPTQDYTVENVVMNHNGEKGSNVYETQNGLWQNVEASYNNWRGGQGSYYDWAAGGMYVVAEHNATYSGLTLDFNMSNGIHWDTNNENIQTTNLVARNNLASGLMLEKNDGPTSVSNSLLCYNSTPGLYTGEVSPEGGMEIRDTEYATISNSRVYGNGVTAITLQGEPGGIEIQNWETGQKMTVDTENFTLSGNAIVSLGSSIPVFKDSYLGGSDWHKFQSTLASGDNDWWNAQDISKAYDVPTPSPGTLVDFSTWQSDTNQDSTSEFTAPSGNVSQGCGVTPDFPDYWLLVDSPAISINSSGTAVFSLGLNPLNFTGVVNLTVDGISEVPGLSGSLSQSSLQGTSGSTLTLTATKVAKGRYPITVFGNGGGITHTVTFSLVIN